MRPDIVGGHGMISRQIFRALARRDDLETAGARPIDKLAGQGRLVAIGHRIDDALGTGLLGEERSGEHIGLDIDHDDVLSRGDRGLGMRDARSGDAGRLDDDLDISIAAGLDAGRYKAGARDAGRVPSDLMARGARPLRIEIGDHRDLQPRNGRHL